MEITSTVSKFCVISLSEVQESCITITMIKTRKIILNVTQFAQDMVLFSGTSLSSTSCIFINFNSLAKAIGYFVKIH